MIDGWLTEINVTSPTGIRAIERLGGPDLAAAIWDAIEARRARRRWRRRGDDDPLSIDGRPSRPPRPRRALQPVRPRRDRRRSSNGCAPRQATTKRRSAAARSSVFAAALEAGRAEARRALEEGGRGRACAARSATSRTRSSARSTTWRRAGSAPAASKAAPPTIVAVGGYGRGMLAPGSDIDLLFLIADKQDAARREAVETMLYVLWDLKQKVGHATRTIDECLRQARADMTIRTSLLEARLDHAATQRSCSRRCSARFDKEIVAKTAPRIRRRQARRARRARQARRRVALSRRAQHQGGQGRLARPQHAVLDRQIRLSGARSARTGRQRACSRSANSRCSRAARNFCGAVRCHLHFLTGRAEERLSFDVQRPIAERLGYADPRRPGRRRALHEALFPRRQGRRRPDGDRLRRARGAPGQADAGVRPLPRPAAAAAAARSPTRVDFKIDNDRVNVIRADAFERDPVNLIRLFWVADRSNLPSIPDATRLVTQSLKRIDAGLRADPEANRLFLEILTSRRVAGDGAAADERGRRARPLHPRLRPRRRA